MDGVTDDGAPPERWVGHNFSLIDQISRIKLVVGDNFIGIGLSELLISGVEVAVVLFGPFDLYPDAAKVSLSSHGPEEQ